MERAGSLYPLKGIEANGKGWVTLSPLGDRSQWKVTQPMERVTLSPLGDRVTQPMERVTLSPKGDRVTQPMERVTLSPLGDRVTQPMTQPMERAGSLSRGPFRG